MRREAQAGDGFTLVELLVVVAIIGILAALIFPAFSAAKAKGRRTICLANVKQINQGVMMYAADNQDTLFPVVRLPDNTNDAFFFFEWTAFVPLTGRYVGWKSEPSPQDKIFACPADTYHYDFNSNSMGYWVNESLHLGSNVNYSSYIFNAGNAVFQGAWRDRSPGFLPGVLGSRLGSISTPAKTVLLGEEPAWFPYSWHTPARPRQHRFNNALDMLGFADGHVSYVKMYCPDPPGYETSLARDPPAGYDYKWTGN